MKNFLNDLEIYSLPRIGVSGAETMPCGGGGDGQYVVLVDTLQISKLYHSMSLKPINYDNYLQVGHS